MAWIERTTAGLGTLANFKAVWNQLETDLAANGWTVNAATANNADPEVQEEIYLEAPGWDITRKVFICMRTHGNVVNDTFSIDIRGATGYDSGSGFTNQPSVTPNPVYCNLHNTTMEYWLGINDRRFVAIIKAGNVYHTIHAGFMLPFATPAQYPFPLYIASCFNSISEHTNPGNSAGFRNFVDPGAGAAYVRLTNGQWLTVGNHGVAGLTDQHSDLADNFTLHPYSARDTEPSIQNEMAGLNLRSLENGDDARPIFPVTFIDGTPDRWGVIGQLEDAFYIAGAGSTPESTFNDGVDDFTIFPNQNRNDFNHFFCMREV